jgi:hypothetical protein
MEGQQTERRTSFISLRAQLLVGFTLLFSAIFGGAFYWFYTFATDVAMSQIQDDLVDTLHGAIAGIDGDAFAALAAEGEPREDGLTDDPRYWKQLEWLGTVHKIEPRAYPYTYVKGDKPNEMLFINDILVITDPERRAGFRESYIAEDDNGQPLPVLSGLITTTFRTTPYTDKWGSWISVYAPISNSKGEEVGALGIDFRADYVFKVQEPIRTGVAVAIVITYPSLFLLVLLVSGGLSRPIIALTAAAGRIGEGDYEQDLSQLRKGRFRDEISTLAEVFEIMVGKVYRREQTLRRQVEELRIEIDEVKRKKQVSEIVGTDFFQDLQAKARSMRRRSRGEEQDTPEDEAP